MDEKNFDDVTAAVSLAAWKAAPERDFALSKDGFAGSVLKSVDDVVSFIRDEGGSEEDVELAVKEMDAAGGQGAMISATISTESVDRQNDTISIKGWELKNYRKNPVILLNHASRSMPIGIATSTFKSKKENALKQTILFNSRDLDEQGWQCGEFYKAGKMRAFSVGFRALQWEINKERSGDDFFDVAIDFQKQELLENSAVTIPANSDAMADAKSLGTSQGFLRLAVEAIDKSGGWAFAPDDVKAAYTAIKDLDDKRIIIDLGASSKSISALSPILDAATAEKSATKDESGDSPALDGDIDIDEDDAKQIAETVADLVDSKLASLKEELNKSITAATGRLD